MKGYIYKYTFQNGKVYIGQTIHPRARKTQHFCKSTGQRHVSFWRAYEKYGFPDYEIIEVIEKETREELCDTLNEREQYYIAFYKSNNKRYGYNLTSGGKVFIVSEEGRMHMSEARSDKMPILQYDLNGDFIAEYESTTKAAKAIDSYPSSVWACCLGTASGRKAKKVQMIKGYTFRFKRDFPDVPSHINLNITSIKRPVLQFALNGRYIQEWESVLDAAKGVGCQESGIRQCCYGSYKQCHGYMWRYRDLFDAIPEQISPFVARTEWPTPKFTQEQIERGRRNQREKCAKPVLQFSLAGEYLREYSSLADAAKVFNAKGAIITNACKHKVSKSAYGYQWRFKADVSNPEKGIEPYEVHMGGRYPILQFTCEGELVKEWPGVKEAAKQLGIGRVSLSLALSGKKDQAHGYRWRYKDKVRGKRQSKLLQESDANIK